MQGLLDIDSVEWFEPKLTITPNESVLEYKGVMASDRIKKINCDLSRICMLEDHVSEWYTRKYFYA
jgi:hypothetical protein